MATVRGAGNTASGDGPDNEAQPHVRMGASRSNDGARDTRQQSTAPTLSATASEQDARSPRVNAQPVVLSLRQLLAWRSVSRTLAPQLQQAAVTFARNFLLAFNIRAGIGVLLRVIQLLRKEPRSLFSVERLLAERNLVFRVDAARVALFVGGFTGLYKAANAVLAYFRQRVDGWNASVAGFVASIAIGALDPVRRRTLALYLFARALQCSYNASKARGWWHMWGSHWKHGDALLFAVTTAQVMYAYAMRPDTLPPSYYKFIVQTGPIAPFALEQTRTQVRGQPIDAHGCLKFMQRSGACHTPGAAAAASAAAAVQWRNPNSAKFAEVLQAGLSTGASASGLIPASSPAYPPAMPCGFLHPQHRLCSMQALHTWLDGFRRTFPLYLSLNLVPLAVLKFKAFLQRPATMLKRAVFGAARSSTFMACFVSGYMAIICAQRRVMGHDHKLAYWGAGLAASLSVLFEAKSRRSELALYVLPRAADSMFMVLRDHHWLASMPHGEFLLFAGAMACVMYFYQAEHDTLSPLLYKLLRRFIDPAPSPAHAHAHAQAHSVKPDAGGDRQDDGDSRDASGAAASG